MFILSLELQTLYNLFHLIFMASLRGGHFECCFIGEKWSQRGQVNSLKHPASGRAWNHTPGSLVSKAKFSQFLKSLLTLSLRDGSRNS